MYQEIYEQYKSDSDFRNECLTKATVIGSRIVKGGKVERLYQFSVGEQCFRIRHNADGTFTAM